MPPAKEAGLLTIPQPKEMAVYGLCGPAQAKQINYERRQMHTYYNKWPLGHDFFLQTLPRRGDGELGWSSSTCKGRDSLGSLALNTSSTLVETHC